MFNIGQSFKLKAFSGSSLLTSFRNISYLGKLEPFEGAVTQYKRLGRGPASGKGKTSGRGQKGQKARGKVPKWYEGGQTPFYKRFPIIGFKRPHRKIYHDINLERIQDFWNTGRIPLNPGETLTIKVMKDCGIISGTLKDGAKILANGKEDYNVPLSIEASKASLSAIRAIENLEQKFTAVYHSELGLKAHVDPDYFYLRKGYLPLQARPTHRRDIGYYSNPDKRGYLLENKSILLDHMGQESSARRNVRKSELAKQLESASNKTSSDFAQSSEISVADL
ncbi:DEHA2C06622p [Debaryomyces hansenii CBS767]|jgi:large subunit ribosomal protein L15|uniref:DEHA2C06622p n=1 Tax=Debaryomyces hansenii (strain ATCC 36239 / CBS 767 / BCRC 21394 / JCM 1990 / NBRC 0083 / IGC 2968) TaxID=284592 RepID=Q6BUZ6_DEBHA|nr:mitochondrial 54S ribosomal protein YmL10/YmL18 [Debaryomyces hansenii CBS767]CAG86031.1 DEHA2C06622p [Debaryomyces hansenii CBS767]|eukprot:XP_457973.1 mitochondrial 54S ribosomal protein YmL10/YmL18 [Debaryomyces hansenii CBS767]